jgi:DNA (cytosine-5)-methyltransferase 1
VVREALSGLPLDISPDWKRLDGTRVVRVTKREGFFQSVTSRIPEGIGDPLFIEAYKTHSIVTGWRGTKHSSDLEARYGALAAGKSDSRTKSTRLDPNGYCPTLRAGTGPDKGSFQAVRPIHHSRPRVITPREAARLQGFPDWYQFDPTKWHSFRQIGNSVSPLVSEYVMKKVMGVLTDGRNEN